MRIEHAAIWVKDLEMMKDFYMTYFKGSSNELYHNPNKNFKSYFISFETGCRLELMQKTEILDNGFDLSEQYIGLNHLAFSVGSQETVDSLTQELKEKGYKSVGAPRTTGDGYYESVILDPENNRIEITI